MACRVRIRRWARAGRPGPRRFALVAFALVVGPGDGVGAQRCEGGQEHGALEPLITAVGDVLAPDGGARSPSYWCQAGVGGQLDSADWRSRPESRPARTAAAGTPLPGTRGQDLVKKVGHPPASRPGWQHRPLRAWGDEVEGQVGQRRAGSVGAGSATLWRSRAETIWPAQVVWHLHPWTSSLASFLVLPVRFSSAGAGQAP